MGDGSMVRRVRRDTRGVWVRYDVRLTCALERDGAVRALRQWLEADLTGVDALTLRFKDGASRECAGALRVPDGQARDFAVLSEPFDRADAGGCSRALRAPVKLELCVGSAKLTLMVAGGALSEALIERYVEAILTGEVLTEAFQAEAERDKKLQTPAPPPERASGSPEDLKTQRGAGVFLMVLCALAVVFGLLLLFFVRLFPAGMTFLLSGLVALTLCFHHYLEKGGTWKGLMRVGCGFGMGIAVMGVCINMVEFGKPAAMGTIAVCLIVFALLRTARRSLRER